MQRVTTFRWVCPITDPTICIDAGYISKIRSPLRLPVSLFLHQMCYVKQGGSRRSPRATSKRGRKVSWLAARCDQQQPHHPCAFLSEISRSTSPNPRLTQHYRSTLTTGGRFVGARGRFVEEVPRGLGSAGALARKKLLRFF